MKRYPPWGMLGPRAIALWALHTQTSAVRVEGLEHVPAGGPALIVARHYHHLLDGAVLVRHVPRPVHVVVALDWAADAAQRRWMERACELAQWPVILRPRTTGLRAAYGRGDVARYLRTGLRDAARLLREGRVVAVFPEGYPVVDAGGPEPAARDAENFLPFAGGYRAIARLARREVPIVPCGLHYEAQHGSWRITARFGVPLSLAASAGDVERAVRALSRA